MTSTGKTTLGDLSDHASDRSARIRARRYAAGTAQ